MRDGYRVFDTDTHLESSAETMERYFDAPMRARLPELAELKEPMRVSSSGTVPAAGKHQYRLPGRVSYQRLLGQAGPAQTPVRNLGRFNGTVTPTQGAADDRAEARIQDMDREGVDAALMLPGIPANVFASRDIELQLGLIRAEHRMLDDFCGKYPTRLKSLITVSAAAIEQCVEEIRRWGGARWAVGVWPVTVDKPIDHPDFEPVWKACADYDLCVVYHGYTWNPPYFPGYRDIWDNVFLGRSVAHPWGAMRFSGAFVGAGIMDRYPALRAGILESCCSWLPFWSRRLDDQAEYLGTVAAKHKLSDYLLGGRFFSSVELPEGQELVRMTLDFMGEQTLMYASDYPHAESMFPASVDHFLGWERLSNAHKRKLLWENPVRFYGEP